MPPPLATPPPNALQDDPHGADAARQRLAPKRRLARLLSRPSIPRLSAPSPVHDSPDAPLHTHHDAPISLDSTALISHDDSLHQDKYQWAVLYENQRGITAFSIPYYSSLSLLPADPAPFTLPDPSLEPSHHPPVSPSTYPLPDGNWHWVSRAWMIDMRSDTGQVQHDGFEYNWIFRRQNWKSHVGPMNIAGYVRRRRWIRLMVRPASHRHPKGDNGTPISSASSTPSFTPRAYRHSLSSSTPPSLMTGLTELTAHSFVCVDPNEVWSGTDPDDDWDRCRRLMKLFVMDGRKLELWRLWLGFRHNEPHNEMSEKVRGKRKQWTEDEESMPSEAAAAARLLLNKDTINVAPREYVVPVLEKYAQSILHLFIFPESRAQFLRLLGQAGLLLFLNLSLESGVTELDFWSYASGLVDFPGSEEVILKSPLAKEVFCKPRGEAKGK